MKKPVFPFPDEPPPWLDQWLGKREITRIFNLRIQAYANKVGHSQPIRRLHWTDSTLELVIGSQRPVWRLENGQWHRSCTCGYPEATCVHCYLAAHLLHVVSDQKRWPLPGDAKSVDGQVRKPAVAAAPPGFTQLQSAESFRSKQDDLFSAPTYQSTPRSLIVEADFKYHSERVTIRFFCMESERKRILNLQEVYNISAQVKNHPERARDCWSDEDVAFLEWFNQQYKPTPRSSQHSYYYPYYYRPPAPPKNNAPYPELEPAIKQNLNVLKLFESSFQKWQEKWQDSPGRFIERDSQKPLNCGPEECRLHFELFEDGEMIRVAAVIVLPDGKRYHFHEIFNLLAEGRKQLIVEGRMLDFEPPVSWKVLSDFFARKSPGIPREHVLEFLPPLVENRFDLLSGQPLRKNEQSNAHLSLTVDTDGGDIILTPRIGSATVYPEAPPAGNLRQAANGMLEVTLYQAPALPAMQAFLRSLPLRRNGQGGGLRLPGRVEAVGELLKQWRQLPEEIDKQWAPQLAALLNPQREVKPLLKLRRSAVFYDVTLAWQVNGMVASEGEITAAMRHDPPVARMVSGYWLSMDADDFVEKRQQLGSLGFGAGDQLRLFAPDIRRLLWQLQNRGMEYGVNPPDLPVHDDIINQPEPPELLRPPELEPVLRDYQKKGFTFLGDRLRYQIGAILADDMGLGKTLQVLSLLQALHVERGEKGKEAGYSDFLALIVCPASVASVWIDECAKFCPQLRAQLYAGPPQQRQQLLEEGKGDLLVANYSLVRNDIESLRQSSFEVVVLDEAQQIKNPAALVTQAVKQLAARQRLALTGTPLENRLLDLWSIMDFLNPDFLSDMDRFIKTYENSNRASELGRYIAPLMLRRTKEMVAQELPPRISEVIKVELGEAQRSYYDRLLVEAREKAAQSNTAIEILALLTRLRQACCDPRLIRQSDQEGVVESAKLETMLEMIEELIAENHSILVFSQFTTMLQLIEERLCERRVNYSKITGATPVSKRGELVAAFNESPEPGVFLLSLKAAGTGLTLTRADYVFIFDPWWNPAVENQAIDRTHRIGQTKTVVAYRLVAAGTIEESVMRMQEEKAELFSNLVADTESGQDAPLARLTTSSLQQLLEIG